MSKFKMKKWFKKKKRKNAVWFQGRFHVNSMSFRISYSFRRTGDGRVQKHCTVSTGCSWSIDLYNIHHAGVRSKTQCHNSEH